MFAPFLTILSLLATDPNEGVTVFGETKLEQNQTTIPGFTFTTPWKAESAYFMEYEQGIELDWHTTPQTRILMICEGELQFELRDGTVKVYGPGDFFLAADLEGSGHRAKTLSKGGCLVVNLAKE